MKWDVTSQLNNSMNGKYVLLLTFVTVTVNSFSLPYNVYEIYIETVLHILVRPYDEQYIDMHMKYMFQFSVIIPNVYKIIWKYSSDWPEEKTSYLFHNNNAINKWFFPSNCISRTYWKENLKY